MRRAGLTSIVVVLGAAADVVVDKTVLDDVTIVIDPEWQEGVAASIRAGLDVMTRDEGRDSAAIVSVSQPGLSADVLARVVTAHEGSELPVTIAKYRYQDSLPLVVHRNLWPRLMGLEGDPEPETLFKTHAEWVREVWVDLLPPTTVASAADLEALAPRS